MENNENVNLFILSEKNWIEKIVIFSIICTFVYDSINFLEQLNKFKKRKYFYILEDFKIKNIIYM